MKFLIMAFICASALFAQNENTPAFLTMEEAISRALALNNQIRSSDSPCETVGIQESCNCGKGNGEETEFDE